MPHGVKVVKHVVDHEGLVAFEKMWRQHFLDTMKPQHLPAMWSVDHSHDELAELDRSLKHQLLQQGSSDIVESVRKDGDLQGTFSTSQD